MTELTTPREDNPDSRKPLVDMHDLIRRLPRSSRVRRPARRTSATTAIASRSARTTQKEAALMASNVLTHWTEAEWPTTSFGARPKDRFKSWATRGRLR
jgi:hypothetical protein